MGDTKNLVIFCECPHLRADSMGNFSATFASISSKMRSGIESCAASADLIASINLEISPLEAMDRSGFKGSPGLGEKSSSTASNPLERGSFNETTFASNSDCRKPRSFRLRRTFSESLGAALSRSLRKALPI